MQNILNELSDEIPVGLVVVDPHGVIKHMNRWMGLWAATAPDDVIGRQLSLVFPGINSAALADRLARNKDAEGNRYEKEEDLYWADAGLSQLSIGSRQLHQLVCFSFFEDVGKPCHALLFYDPDETKMFHRGFGLALHRLHAAQSIQRRLQRKLERANSHLLQSEKLAGIGQLAAGVAHEINNPIGYVFSNLKTLACYMRDMLKIIDAVDSADTVGDLRQLKRTLEYDYIRGDVEALIDESEEGINRVKKIITALKDFSHIDEEGFHKADLHRGIDTTLSIVNNEIKYKAKVIKDYARLPKIDCNASQINQVVMNLLVNAAQAITSFGTITIRTGHEDPWVWVEIQDSGRGMDAPTVGRIFEPFFTTKALGTGTGLGLSLSYSIVQKHYGRIEVFSEPGEGARFRVWLPITHTELLDL
ncbi:MAG TPA: ATP-binding protein [Eoetvoesiella sp.]